MNPAYINPRIEAIVFDMDGVLLNTEAISERAWRAAAVALSLPEAMPLYACCAGMTVQKAEESLAERLGEGKARQFMREWDAGFDRIASAEGIPKMPFAAEALKSLESRYRLALATSTAGARARAQLGDAGLLGFFGAIAAGDMVKSGKPAPDIYLAACKMLDVPPERCAAVEDSPNGIESAHAAGLYPVMIPDRVAPSEATLSLLWRRYSSLKEFCEAALGGF